MTSSTEPSDTRPTYSPFAKETFGRGMTEGRRETILIVLEARGLDVSDAERARIVTCTNLNQLKTWVRRAVRAEKTSDLFK